MQPQPVPPFPATANRSHILPTFKPHQISSKNSKVLLKMACMSLGRAWPLVIYLTVYMPSGSGCHIPARSWTLLYTGVPALWQSCSRSILVFSLNTEFSYNPHPLPALLQPRAACWHKIHRPADDPLRHMVMMLRKALLEELSKCHRQIVVILCRCWPLGLSLIRNGRSVDFDMLNGCCSILHFELNRNSR